ncbi:MAG: ribosome recycling factor [Patescibacteria group bacterium]|jgi:ribosome recycling factor|nr:ribosome recycling factor [Patescibacteria group bacterium]
MDVTNNLKQQIHKVLEIIKTDVSSIRTGRANGALVENIQIVTYGGSTKLRVIELATISTTDAQTLVISPFDPSTREDIRKGIMEAGSGLNPVDDGQILRINIPQLSTERREELIKMMKQKLENGKIMVRQARQEAMNEVKKEEFGEDEEKRIEKEIQKIVDDTIVTIDSIGHQKEEELLQI